MLVKQYGKEKHGLRSRDLEHHDKQNFDAVLNIMKASHLFESMPDAIATKYYIDVMNSIVSSYLDKSISPEKRIMSRNLYGISGHQTISKSR